MIVPPTTEQLREMSAAPCPYWHNHTNPPAGLGWCELRKVSRYPMQPHYCKQMETEEDER